MEGRRYEKRKKDRKEEGIQGERRKEKKNLLLALNRLGYFCWSFCLWNGAGGVVGRFDFTFLPS